METQVGLVKYKNMLKRRGIDVETLDISINHTNFLDIKHVVTIEVNKNDAKPNIIGLPIAIIH